MDLHGTCDRLPGEGIVTKPRLWQDVARALRFFRRRPSYGVAAALIMAVGIGAGTAVFSVVSGVLLKPLPFAEPDRLVMLREVMMERGVSNRLSPPTFLDWRARQRSFTGLAAYSETFFTLISGGEPRRVEGAAVSANWFSFLGVRPQLGREFVAAEDEVDAPATVIIGHALWTRDFGGDPEIVGRTVRLDDEIFEVVGVAPPGFDYPQGAELWTPLFRGISSALEIRGARFLVGLGRLAPGASIESAAADLNAVNADIPDLSGWGAQLTPLREFISGETRRPLLILLAAVGLLLLIACANVANLVLAQTTGRRRELAIRSALGAGRWRIAGGLLVETVTLSLVGGAFGLLFAAWSVDTLLALNPMELPRADEIGIDWRVMAFAVGISVVTGLLAGLVPALRSSRADLAATLKEGGPTLAGGVGTNRLRRALVVAEVAVSLVLLAGAALMAKSFVTVLRVDPGFNPRGVLSFELTLPDYRYGQEPQVAAFQSELLERLRAQPGVTSVALASNMPFGGTRMTSPVTIEDRVAEADEKPARVEVSAVSADFFSTLGIPVVEGRGFTAGDATGEPVAIVNEAFVRKFFPEGGVLGQRAATWFGPRTMREIVGVVADVRHGSLTEEAHPFYYAAMVQEPKPFFRAVVRSDISTPALIGQVRQVVHGIDPGLPISKVATLEELVARSVGDSRFYAVMLGAFAALAAALAALGFYAVLAHLVAQRYREMGIRIALGARRDDVVRLVMTAGLKLTLVGVALGLVGAALLTRTLESLLFGVSTLDPVALASAVAVLTLIALAATYGPARQASRVDPVTIIGE